MVMKGIFPRREEIFRFLQTYGPSSSLRISKISDTCLRQVQYHLKALKEVEHRVYICDWTRSAIYGDLTPVYDVRLNDERNVPKPPRISPLEKSRRDFKNRKTHKARKELSWMHNIFRPINTSTSQDSPTAHETQ